MENSDNELEEKMFNFTDEKEKNTFREEEEIKRQALLDTYNFNTMKGVISDNQMRPVNILGFNLIGADGKYRESFLKQQLSPLLQHLNDGGKHLTLSKVLENIDRINYNLIKTDCITGMGCQLSIPEQQPLNIFYPDLLNIIVNM